MSIPSYASRLSHNPNKGPVGLPEVLDSERAKKFKLKRLLQFVREAKSVVCLTGAGISTSAGIADFRGPNGVWTKEVEGRKSFKSSSKNPEDDSIKGTTRKKRRMDEECSDDTFEKAKPTVTHEVIVELVRTGKISMVVSQNVDGLHMRSGLKTASKFIPSNSHGSSATTKRTAKRIRSQEEILDSANPNEELSKLVELHGNVFLESCQRCRHEILHDKDVGGISCRPTGNICPKCHNKMVDTVLDWDTPIDDSLLELAEQSISHADLVLCLGTSLRIVPAAELPLLVGTSRTDDIEPRICIINLQATPLDDKADLVIRSRVDDVMTFLRENLR